MEFGSVLKRSWDITWKHKGLWVLGILAGCSASGRGSGGQMTSGFRGYQFEGREFPQLEQFFGRMSDEVAVAVVLALLGFFLGLLNGFLIMGTLWFYLHRSGYAIGGITPPPENTPAWTIAQSYLVPVWLTIPALYVAIALAFVFIIIVFI